MSFSIMSSLCCAVSVSSHNAYFMSYTTWALVSCLLLVSQYLSLHIIAYFISNTAWALVSCLLFVVQYLSLYIDVSSSRDEVFQQMQVAILCCDEEGRGSIDHLCVEVGSPAEKFLHHIQMITLTSHKQRGTPILIITPGLNITVTLKTTTFKSSTIKHINPCIIYLS